MTSGTSVNLPIIKEQRAECQAIANRIWPLVAVLSLGIAIRCAVALHPYSGEHDPPMFGDYEAQRHWMEISLNVPIRDWYTNTTDNDLRYWGLDYPPLSGYVSWFLGKLVEAADPQAVQLFISRGYETKVSRAAMRLTVLIADLFVFGPALLLLVWCLYGSRHGSNPEDGAPLYSNLEVITFCVTLPALLLIDHAHFQYNNISIGFFLCSLFCFIQEWDVIGAGVYCCAIYFKHMTLYTSFAIFTLLLNRLVQKAKAHGIFAALIFGTKILASIATISILVFNPWLHDKNAMLGVLWRLFPVSRGLYEDKVANVWCSLSIVVKLNRFMEPGTLFKFCALVTVFASLPFCVGLLLKPSPYRLLLSCSGCGLAAFLFSYQVHEKQILIPLAPVALLYGRYPLLASWMSITASFSLFPLILREGSELAYFATLTLHCLVVFTHFQNESKRENIKPFQVNCQLTIASSFMLGLILNFSLIFGTPPTFAPDIFILMNTIYASAHFCLMYLAIIYHMMFSS